MKPPPAPSCRHDFPAELVSYAVWLYHVCSPNLRAYDSVGEARSSLGRYLAFYNHKRPHSSLDGRTPDRAYFDGLPQAVAA